MPEKEQHKIKLKAAASADQPLAESDAGEKFTAAPAPSVARQPQKPASWREKVSLGARVGLPVVIFLLAVASGVMQTLSNQDNEATGLSEAPPAHNDTPFSRVRREETKVRSAVEQPDFLKRKDEIAALTLERDQLLGTETARLKTMGPSITPQLVQCLVVADGAFYDDRVVAQRTLVEFGAQSVDPLLSTRSKNDCIVKTLMSIGDPAIKAVLDKYESKKPVDKSFAVHLMREMTEVRQPTKQDLQTERAMSSDDFHARFATFPSGRYMPVPLSEANAARIERLIKQSDSVRDRETLVGMLGLCSPSESVLRTLHEILATTDVNSPVRQQAAVAISNIYRRNGGLLDQANNPHVLPLTLLCRDYMNQAWKQTTDQGLHRKVDGLTMYSAGSWSVGGSYSALSSALGFEDGRLIRKLCETAHGNNDEAAEAAIMAIGNFKDGRGEELFGLIDLSRLPSEGKLPAKRRQLAWQMISKFDKKYAGNFVYNLTEYLEHPPVIAEKQEMPVRMAAIELLGTYGAQARQALPALERIATTDKEPGVVSEARKAIEAIKSNRGGDMSREYLDG